MTSWRGRAQRGKGEGQGSLDQTVDREAPAGLRDHRPRTVVLDGEELMGPGEQVADLLPDQHGVDSRLLGRGRERRRLVEPGDDLLAVRGLNLQRLQRKPECHQPGQRRAALQQGSARDRVFVH